VVEGESLEFPVSGGELGRERFAMVRRVGDVKVDDWFDNITLTDHKGYHSFKIKSLKRGFYDLEFFDGHETIKMNITVYEGSRWEGSENFII